MFLKVAVLQISERLKENYKSTHSLFFTELLLYKILQYAKENINFEDSF